MVNNSTNINKTKKYM